MQNLMDAADGKVVTADSRHGTAPDAEPSGADSIWVHRAVGYAVQAVENAERAHRLGVEHRLDRPSRNWSRAELVRTYNAGSDGERRYREEAAVLRSHGYRAWLPTASHGDARRSRILIDAALGSPAATRMVTWVRDAASPQRAAAGAP